MSIILPEILRGGVRGGAGPLTGGATGEARRNPSTTLRPARAADGPGIGAILSDWIDETRWMPRIHTRGQDIAHGTFLIEKTSVTVAVESGRVIGFLARQDVTIDALYLAPAARGQGLGRRLLNVAKDGAPRLELWTFQANMGARVFYAREGFREVRTTDGDGNDEGLPDVFMIWQREGIR